MGIDVKIESPYGPDAEVLGDPSAFVPLFLAVANATDTKCLQFIDAYGDTVFNHLQIPVLIEELRSRLILISVNTLKRYRESALRHARDANWASAIIKEFEKEASASQSEVESELSRLRQHIDVLTGVLEAAVRAGPHHYVRFIGD